MTEQNQHIIELIALYSVVNSLNANSGQAQILTEVLETLERDLGFRRCTVMLLSPDGNELVFEATSNNQTVKESNKSYRIGEGVTGNVLRSGQPAVIERISDEPAFRFRIHKRHKDENIQTGLICVPIIIGSEVIGTLSADFPHKKTFRSICSKKFSMRSKKEIRLKII